MELLSVGSEKNIPTALQWAELTLSPISARVIYIYNYFTIYIAYSYNKFPVSSIYSVLVINNKWNVALPKIYSI